jgi:hypothetical protein
MIRRLKMSKRGFWLGLVVGAVITGLLVAVAMFVVLRFRLPATAVYGLRGRQFGVNPRGLGYPRLPGRSFGFGAMLCGPLLLLAGAVVLGALLGRHWHMRRHDRDASCCGGQPSSVGKGAEVAPQPPAEAVQREAEPEPPAGAGESEAKG